MIISLRTYIKNFLKNEEEEIVDVCSVDVDTLMFSSEDEDFVDFDRNVHSLKGSLWFLPVAPEIEYPDEPLPCGTS